MFQSIYTNTSSVKGIVGLLVLTLGVSYVKENSTEIVDGIKTTVKNVGERIDQVAHAGKTKVHELKIDKNGRVYDYGKGKWI